MTRIPCIIPFCRCTRKPMFGPDEEWICDRHYKAVPRALQLEYEAAWREAVKADKRADDGMEVSEAIYARVTDAFKACKAAAVEAAGGLR